MPVTHVLIIRRINTGLKSLRSLIVLLCGWNEKTTSQIIVRARGVLVRLQPQGNVRPCQAEADDVTTGRS